VRQHSLSRIFWIGAAAILIVAALVGIVGILRGDLGETDAKILGTLGTLLLAGATAIAGYALVERGLLVPFGWAAATVAGGCFLLVTTAIWKEFDNDLGAWAVRSIVLLVALLLVTTQTLLLRVDSLKGLVGATAVATGLATLFTAVAIGVDEGGDGLWQGAAIFWIFGILGYLLLPVLQRFRAAGPAEGVGRVLAELDGIQLIATRAGSGIDVRLGPGERLVLKRRG
jgi:hypothetical protein